MRRLRPLLLCLSGLLTAGAGLRAADRPATAFTVRAPVTDFQVATFTPHGYRAWLLRGAEGQYVSATELKITGLNLTVFTDDAANRVESIFLSPEATAALAAGQVHGPGALRLITDDFEATGEDWFYDHRQKKVSIRKNVRVVFHARLASILR